MRPNSPTNVSRLARLTERCAPFGVPVVPDVKIVVRPCRDGGVGSASEFCLMRSKIVGSDVGPSLYVTQRFLSGAPFSTIAVNSWS